MLSYKKNGSILDENLDVIINPVNCVGVMGAGLALKFKNKYPEMFLAYKEQCKHNLLKLGMIDVYQEIEVTIINFPTKHHWMDKSNYNKIEDGCLALHAFLEHLPPSSRVGIPALGCGLGGLNWIEVKKLFTKIFSDLNLSIIIFEPHKRSY